MKKRWITCILMLILTAAVLSGCGSKEHEEPVLMEQNEQESENEILGTPSDKGAEEESAEPEFADRAIEWGNEELKNYMQSVTGIADRDIMLSDLKGIEELDLRKFYVTAVDLEFLSSMPDLKILFLNPSVDSLANGLESAAIEMKLELPESLEELTIDNGQHNAVSGKGICISGLPKLSKLRLIAWDISELSDLPALTDLDLSFSTRLEDISSLEKFSGLTSLNLSSCFKIDSLEAISGMTSLTSLDISGCSNITDLEPLADLTNLTSLNVSSCNISSLVPLTNLINLTELDLSGNMSSSNINSIEPLTGMKHLRTLKLSSDSLADINALSELTSLEELHLAVNTNVFSGDLNVLSSLSSVKILDFYCYGSFDINIFSGMTGLEELYLSPSMYGAGVLSLSVLADLPNLTSLHLEGVDERDIHLADLTECKSLRELDLNTRKLTDYSFLAGLPELTSLRLDGGSIYITEEVSAILSDLTNLQELVIGSGCIVADWSFLPKLTKLIKLDMSVNVLSSMDILANLTNLTELNLSNCLIGEVDKEFGAYTTDRALIEDVSVLAELKNLTKVDLSSCNITDVSPLSGLTNLTELNLQGNPVTDYSPVEFVPELYR